MESESGPFYRLDTIKALIERGDNLPSDYAVQGWHQLGLTLEEVIGCIADLDESLFLYSRSSTAEGHEGEPWDAYVYPYPERTSRKGLLFKFVLVDEQWVRIFSLHRTKVPRRLR
jgi:hypothetical protein